MARKISEGQDGDVPRGIRGAVARLNRALVPWLGPPPLGPYDDPPVSIEVPRCPLCDSPMDEHVVDRSGPRTMLSCPR